MQLVFRLLFNVIKFRLIPSLFSLTLGTSTSLLLSPLFLIALLYHFSDSLHVGRLGLRFSCFEQSCIVIIIIFLIARAVVVSLALLRAWLYEAK